MGDENPQGEIWSIWDETVVEPWTRPARVWWKPWTWRRRPAPDRVWTYYGWPQLEQATWAEPTDPSPWLDRIREGARLLASVSDTSAVACPECAGEGVTEGVDFDEPYGRIDGPCTRCNGSGEEPAS